jgi:hypothetical protein
MRAPGDEAKAAAAAGARQHAKTRDAWRGQEDRAAV